MAAAEGPQFASFAPFYTLQPVESTRRKQLKLWQERLCEYHHVHSKTTLVVKDFALWENAAIGRCLDAAGIAAVLGHMVESGHGQWEDEDHTRFEVMWRTPAEWAGAIYDWVVDHSFVGNVFTVYELHTGDDFQGSEFFGIGSATCLKALRVLEDSGRAQVMDGDNVDESGVKFFGRTE